MNEGIRPLPQKTEAIEAFTLPTDIDEGGHFLRLTGYYHKFVPLYADMAKPLNNLLHEKSPIVWYQKNVSLVLNN